MMPKKFIPSIFILFLCFLFTQCEKEELIIADNQTEALGSDAMHPGIMKGKPSPESGVNNLSFPVIWAEGVTKTLPGAPGMTPILAGEWWYWWGTSGTDPNIVPLSCPPDPQDPTRCDDGDPLTAVGELIPFDNPDLVKAYLQKDQNNIWQAMSGTPGDFGVAEPLGELFVDWIDWGDNLESVDWYTRSQVRTEVVLFQDNPLTNGTWLEYGMRHTDGWGITEVHGLAASVDGNEPEIAPGLQATVYSPCARFTIQRLLVERDDPRLINLEWIPGEGWDVLPDYIGDPLIMEPIFNMAVHEAQDGPGYYNAEINVKGRIIYGYTWNVRKLNDGAGDYRLTFSFDATAGSGPALNTFFIQGKTDIMLPLEEELLIAAAEEGEEPGGGGTAVLVPYDPIAGTGNLTYMDVRILERGGGGGGGKPSGGGGGGGHGGGRN